MAILATASGFIYWTVDKDWDDNASSKHVARSWIGIDSQLFDSQRPAVLARAGRQ